MLPSMLRKIHRIEKENIQIRETSLLPVIVPVNGPITIRKNPM